MTATDFRYISEALEPDHDEFKAMVTDLCQRKGWTFDLVGAIVGASGSQMSTYMKELYPPEAVVRTVWVLYMLDHQPACLKDLTWIASWGKGRVATPEKKVCDPVHVAKLEQALREHHALGGGHWTVKTLAHMLPALSESCIRSTARRIDYTLGKLKGMKRPKRNNIWNPASMWIRVDWTQTNDRIAKQTGTKPTHVSRVRAQYAAHPRKMNKLLREIGKL